MNGLISAEHSAKLGCAQKANHRQIASDAPQFVPAIHRPVGRAKKERSLSAPQPALHLRKSRDRLTCPPRQAEQLRAAARQQSLDLFGQPVIDLNRLFRRAGKKMPCTRRLNGIPVGAQPNSSSGQTASDVRHDHIIRSDDKTHHLE